MNENHQEMRRDLSKLGGNGVYWDAVIRPGDGSVTTRNTAQAEAPVNYTDPSTEAQA